MIPCEYDDVTYFSDETTLVEKDGKWGILIILNEV